MIKKLHYLLGTSGLVILCATGCATKQTAVISSQSEAVCVGSSIDRDVLMSQRDIGWTLRLPSDDSSGWIYPEY